MPLGGLFPYTTPGGSFDVSSLFSLPTQLPSPQKPRPGPVTLTRQQFLGQRPEGSYARYLAYLEKNRPKRMAANQARQPGPLAPISQQDLAGQVQGQVAGSINPIDLNQRTVNFLQGKKGDPGPQGSMGLSGVMGPQGVPGGFNPAKVGYVLGPQVGVPALAVGQADATCPAGTKVIGGAFISGLATPFGSYPLSESTWRVLGANDTLVSTTISATAICAAP